MWDQAEYVGSLNGDSLNGDAASGCIAGHHDRNSGERRRRRRRPAPEVAEPYTHTCASDWTPPSGLCGQPTLAFQCKCHRDVPLPQIRESYCFRRRRQENDLWYHRHREMHSPAPRAPD
eukprot:gene22902-biopygen14827